MSFPQITHHDQFNELVKAKPEIGRQGGIFNSTFICYIFQDKDTFDSDLARECRGILFDKYQKIASRPLHKFFNHGEKPNTSLADLVKRGDVFAIYPKLDGSMIATAWIDGKLEWRSKKSFESRVVNLAKVLIAKHPNIRQFGELVASNGMTAIFELTHPQSQVVVAYQEPKLRLLHIRHNETGEYVLLNKHHPAWNWVWECEIEIVPSLGISLTQAIKSLDTMVGEEGYVIQFTNGDMVKLKCPWYLRLHAVVSLMRERDIARLALREELDDVKSAMADAKIDFAKVEAVETRLKDIIVRINNEVENTYSQDKDLTRKDFAIKHKGHPYFSLLMQRFQGKDLGLEAWYERHHLDKDFGLIQLVNEAITE